MREASLKGRLASAINTAFDRIYGWVAGRHPRQRPWHAQRHMASALEETMREVLPPLGGMVLDVGCGERPYERLMTRAERYVGLDVTPGAGVDIVVDPGERWPIEDGTFDTVLCLEVLEHVRDPAFVLAEMRRVLKRGGTAVVAVPFAYTEHGTPHDYRRWSPYGLDLDLSEHFEVVELFRQGRIGTTGVTLFLNFIQLAILARPRRVLIAIVLLPLWLLLCALANAIGAVFDRLDRTESCYANVLAVAVKP